MAKLLKKLENGREVRHALLYMEYTMRRYKNIKNGRKLILKYSILQELQVNQSVIKCQHIVFHYCNCIHFL